MPGFNPKSAKETLNRWIAHETAKAAREITEAIEAYKFNEAAGGAYRFVWNVFCDWYLELAKPLLQGAEGKPKEETRAMTAWVRDEILKLLHPFTPFVTEELWGLTAQDGAARDSLLALASWPKHEALDDLEAEAEIGWVERAPQGAVQLIVRGEVAALPLKDVIDFTAEKARLEKEMARVKSDIARIDAKLANADFVARAPEDVVEGEREKREEAEARRAKIDEALARLKGAA